MSKWGFWEHAPHPFQPHQDSPLKNRFVRVTNELLIAGLAGLGMFSEAYFLFSIGNIRESWDVLYPTCAQGGPDDGCAEQALNAATYVEVAGVILGMLSFGLIAQKLGRKWGSRGTAALMMLGGIVLVCANGPTLTGQFIMFNVGLAIFSIGTGGEYPLSATSVSERSETEAMTRGHDRRGRLMVFTFAMQGWGNFINTVIICFLLACTGNRECPSMKSSLYSTEDGALLPSNCDAQGLDVTWRLQYAFGLLIVLGMLLYRWLILQESEVWTRERKELRSMGSRAQRREKTARHWFICSKAYGFRLFGVSACWFLSDVAFYGTKLFQSTLISVVLGPAHTLFDIIVYTIIYSAVSLVGYYLSAFTIDIVGRVPLQAMGFLIVGGIYLACGFAFDDLQKQPAAFEILFFLSSLFIQWGPNATTWMLPGEIFPTDIRPEAHGIAASWGKLGALTASLLFTFANAGKPVSARFIFICGGFCALVGFIITLIFVPDTTHLSLKDIDRRWQADLNGETYKGPAVCWENLSFLERWIFRVGRSQSVKSLPKADPEREIEVVHSPIPKAQVVHPSPYANHEGQGTSSGTPLHSSRVTVTKREFENEIVRF